MAGLARRLAPAAALGGLAVVIVGVADPALAGHADAIRADHSGLLVDGEQGLADGLARLLGDAALRTRLQAGALLRAAELTWEHTAVANFEVLATGSVANARPLGTSGP